MSMFVKPAARAILNQLSSETVTKSFGSTPLRDLTRYAIGEQVLINGKRLSSPLVNGRTSPVPGDGNNALLQHDNVIGQRARTLRTRDGKGGRYVQVERPTLDEYISLTRRNVTPVYATYASHIVSLLDIHPPTPGHKHENERLEILEAGTGHGSLTLHLARAIAAANHPPPLSALPAMRGKSADADPDGALAEPVNDQEWSSWLSDRQAIVHTVETVPKNSRDAEKLIRGFRRGLYWPHIDFHVGSVGQWLRTKLQERGTEFLSYVLLDMPEVEEMLPVAAQAMKEDALLAVFCPSITQIAECQKLIKEQSVPLAHEQVVELGEGISTGRVWDVRVVVPRKRLAELEALKRAAAKRASSESSSESDGQSDVETIPGDEALAEVEAAAKDVKFVCRPKVFEVTRGGGFVGLWRKSTFSKEAFEAEGTNDVRQPPCPVTSPVD
ncbi:uncharacterized protein AB675_8918 [Cyphellophora attinorum]|uniref:tRNA (adenine(58)-N(1))-methyltransferase catalytic subunit TRM61 n=1 Tax=Cyphellophora attinorum TaxID=1664694 RepID=A0A0N1NYS0_9EURO|nr:uncharacterized protein AB675_8918 [Phialophora attinorum]KPI36180.1 hypothetical protein AB675_8918 [Phialophora attinorum]